jgi:hypothetical protein
MFYICAFHSVFQVYCQKPCGPVNFLYEQNGFLLPSNLPIYWLEISIPTEVFGYLVQKLGPFKNAFYITFTFLIVTVKYLAKFELQRKSVADPERRHQLKS